MSALRQFVVRWEGFLLLVLVLTLFVGTISSQYFATPSNVSIALASMVPIALVALPMTLIIVTGEIDISVGSMIGLCATVLAVVMEHGFGIGWAMLAALAAGAVAGFVNGLFVIAFGLPSLVVTIGTLALYRGIAQILLEERGINDFPDWYTNLGFGTIGPTPIPWSIVPFVLFFLAFSVFLHGTRWGRTIYAIGNNRLAAKYSGVDVTRTMLAVFTASGLMSAFSAVVLTAYLASARSDTAVGLELPVITAVVLGGVNIFGGSGTLGGVLVALLVLAFVQNALGLAGMTPEQQEIVTGAVLIATLVIFTGGESVRRGIQQWTTFRKLG